MKEILAKAIITEFGKEFAKKTSSLTGILKEEYEQFFKHGLSKYLDKNRLKFAKVKTLLHRTAAVKFYDIYQPTKLIQEDELGVGNEGVIIDTNSINNVFAESSCVTIVGDAGSGKSTLVKHLFLNAILEHYYIPVIIELRYLNDFQGTITDFIKEKITENNLSAADRITNRLLENGTFVFFLDGFDEIKASSRNTTIEKLNGFFDKYSANKFIITSRPHSNIELIPNFINYTIKSLDQSEIKSFVQRQKIDKDLTTKIIESIEDNKKVEYIDSFLQNPLLLSLYILTFSTNSSIPERKYIFYRRVFDVLFKEHDSVTKFGYERELSTKLNQEQIEEILKVFSFISYYEDIFTFDKQYLTNTLNSIKTSQLDFKFSNQNLIDDLKSAVALWTEDAGILSFAHRSMQEYFAALYISTYTEDKQVLYDAILEKKKKGFNEVSNLISLCIEMDKNACYRHLLLPTLRLIKSNIDRTNELSIVESLTRLLYTDLGIKYKKVTGYHTSLFCNDLTYYTHFAIPDELIILDKWLFSLPKQAEFQQLIDDGHYKEEELQDMVLDFNRIFSYKDNIIIKNHRHFIDDALDIVSRIDARIIELEEYLKKKSVADKSIFSIASKANTV
jgi:GTPase SAR1 family protein